MIHSSIPIRIFIAYSHQDNALLKQLRNFLSPLEHRNDITMWYDGKIEPGSVWEQHIKDNLYAANIILLLLSADSIASDYFWHREKADALTRHHKGTCIVVPIILRPCNWTLTDLVGLQALPKDAKPITTWNNRDEAYVSIVNGVIGLVDEIKRRWTKQYHEEQNKRQFREQLQTADDLFSQQKYAEAQHSYQILLNWQDKTSLDYTDAQSHLVKRLQLCKEELQFDKLQQQAYNLYERGKYNHALLKTKQALQIKKDNTDLLNLQQELERLIQEINQQWLQRLGIGVGVLILILLGMLMNEQEIKHPKHDSYIESVEEVQFEMVKIPGGTFIMGNNEGNPSEQPAHEVTIDTFYMATHEVTVALFHAFTHNTGYKTDGEKRHDGYSSYQYTKDSNWKAAADVFWWHDVEGKLQNNYQHPVIHVSWNDAMEFCKWLKKKTGKNYTLPTEDQWEYAAGNGSYHTKYAWGNNNPSKSKGGNVADETKLPDGRTWDAKFEDYIDGYWATAPVGQFGVNDFGLYDMTGNVWEWCFDLYRNDYCEDDVISNYMVSGVKRPRVLRGGSWYDDTEVCYVYFRSKNSEENCDYNIGFRIVCDL